MNQSDTRGALRRLGFSLERVVYPVSRWASILSIIAAVVMMLLVTTDVFLRRVLNAPITGAYEIGKLLLTIVIFFAIAYTMSKKGHIAVDVATRLYPQRLRAVARGIGFALILAVVGTIVWGSIGYGWNMFKCGDTSTLLRVPTYPFIFLAACGCAILFFTILVQFIYVLAGVDEESGSTLGLP
jgi:TRAP-type C4-dicarboxylate transport system permease small subunit